jgi:hypothetical protein
MKNKPIQILTSILSFLIVCILIVPAFGSINDALLKGADISRIDYLLLKFRPNFNPVESNFFSLSVIEYNKNANKIDVYYNIENGLFELPEKERDTHLRSLVNDLSSRLGHYLGQGIDRGDIYAVIGGIYVAPKNGNPEIHKIFFNNDTFTYSISDMQNNTLGSRNFDLNEGTTKEAPGI